MQKNKARIFIIVLLLVIVGVIIGWMYLYKPNRSVENERGIEITAAQLVKEFQANEAEANAKYLDKTLQVTGVVSTFDKNQEGQVTIMLSSDDAMTGVFCTLKDDAKSIVGNTVTIKGFCSGMLSDVRIREAVIIK
jgi:uncharacterized protein YpmB